MILPLHNLLRFNLNNYFRFGGDFFYDPSREISNPGKFHAFVLRIWTYVAKVEVAEVEVVVVVVVVEEVLEQKGRFHSLAKCLWVRGREAPL